MALEISVGSGGRLNKPAENPAFEETRQLQAQRERVHIEERSKALERSTGVGLLGQRLSGKGNGLDTLA